MFPKDSMVAVFPPFDADSYPNPNSTSDDESCLNLIDLPLLANGSSDLMDLLPVHDTVAAFPTLEGESYSCPNSTFPPSIFLESNQVYDESIVPETQFTQNSDSFVPETQFTQNSDSFVPETQFTQNSDSFVPETQFTQDSYVPYEPPEFVPIEEKAPSIESKAADYLGTLQMLAIFLPRWIKKDDLDSPYYPATPEVRDFLLSTRYQANQSSLQASSGSSQGSKT